MSFKFLLQELQALTLIFSPNFSFTHSFCFTQCLSVSLYFYLGLDFVGVFIH